MYSACFLAYRVITRTQCGNFMIFLSLRFYVKSILENSRSAKSAILTHSQALNFDIYEILHFLKAEIYQINKVHSPKNSKNDNFRTPIFTKIDFT